MHLYITGTSFFCSFSPPLCHIFPQAIAKYYLLSILIPLKCQFSTIPKPQKLARDLNFLKSYHQTLCVMCPVSHLRCHMSIFKCHLSDVTYHMSYVIIFLQSCEVSLLRVCYQQGPSGLVFRCFLSKMR